MKQKIEMELNEVEFKALLSTWRNVAEHIKMEVAPLLSNKEKDKLAKVLIPLTTVITVLIGKDKHYESVEAVMIDAQKDFLIATGRLNEQ